MRSKDWFLGSVMVIQKNSPLTWEEQMLKLSDQCGLLIKGKWNHLGQIKGWALEGCCKEYWMDAIKAATGHLTTIQTTWGQCEVHQEASHNQQKEAIENCKLWYEGHDHKKVAIQVFQINNFKSFIEDVGIYYIYNMRRNGTNDKSNEHGSRSRSKIIRAKWRSQKTANRIDFCTLHFAIKMSYSFWMRNSAMPLVRL